MCDSDSAGMGSVWTLAYESPSGNSMFSKADIPGVSNRHSNQKIYFFKFLCIDNFVLDVCVCTTVCECLSVHMERQKVNVGVSFYFFPDFVSQDFSLDPELSLEARLAVQDAPEILLIPPPLP